MIFQILFLIFYLKIKAFSYKTINAKNFKIIK